MKSQMLTPRGLLFGLIFCCILNGCATTTGSGATDGHASFCSVATPIYWSKEDTAATIAQAREHNAAGVKICGWGKK